MANNSTPLEITMNGWTFADPPNIASFEFENIDLLYWSWFVNRYSGWCYYLGVLYVLGIFSLQQGMRHRAPFDLKYAFFVWNAALAVFSMVGATRVMPSLIYVLAKENGFYNSICVKNGVDLPNVLWGLLFAFSKIWELGDTVFLVLRKRPLIVLHWYHHLATLVVTWTVVPFMEPIARWYASINYFVHSFMYSYFALKTIGTPVPKYFARLVTTLQFLQMIICLFVNLASFYLQSNPRRQGMGYDCARQPTSIVAFSIVYGSFALLFGKLLFGLHLKSKVPGRNRKME